MRRAPGGAGSPVTGIGEVVTEGGMCRSGLGLEPWEGGSEPARAFPPLKAPGILDTEAIVTLQARSQGSLRGAYWRATSTPWGQEGAHAGTQHSVGMSWGWPDGRGKRQSLRIQELTDHSRWRRDNNKATYTMRAWLISGVRTGRDKGTKWDSGWPGEVTGEA